MKMATALEIRRSREADVPAVLGLLRDCLGWNADVRHEALFSWKHRENPFGPSPAWVAIDGTRLAGLRVLMRWEFEWDGRLVRAVRAVDTATHPDYRGQGVFSRLTVRALEELRAEGVGFVFNTPNDQSRPGYLKMGWRVVGKLPVAVRPSSLRGLARMLRARAPAERWSAATTAGVPAADMLRQRSGLERLLASRARSRGLRTRITPEYLTWRYGSPLLEYRAVAPSGLEKGLALFRVRRRGSAREMVLGEILVPDDEPRLRDHLVRQAIRAADADYVIAVEPRWVSAGLLRLPRQGPTLTWRGLADTRFPVGREWDLRLGDIELF
jgi:GNAT superfamily N-acetyltransferase